MDMPKLDANVLEYPDEVGKFWDWLTHRPQGYVACDIETGSRPGGSELQIFKPGFHVRMMQFGDSQGGWAIDFQKWRGLIEGSFDWISQSRTQHVWHNGFGFDAQSLRQEGIIIDPTNMHDTMIDAGLMGYAGEGKKLKGLAHREFGPWATAGANILDQAKKNAGWTWSDFPMDWRPYPMYGVMDTCITGMLFEKYRDDPDFAKFQPHHDMEIATSVITNQMSRTGFMVDGQYIHDQIIRLIHQEKELEERSEALGWGNPNSRNEVLRILHDAGVLDETRLTEGGQISIDKKQLINTEHPLAQLRLEYMFIQRMRKSYLEKFMGLIGGEMQPAVIHPQIWSMAARTGRMSVSDPPLQQLPSNDHTARRAFIPDNPDHVLVGADFGQIELRCWAILNKDQRLLDKLNQGDETGEDFFVLVARDLFKDPHFQKSDKRRGPIKNTMYATLFAGGDDKIAETAGLPLSEVQGVINMLKSTYPSLRDAGQSMVNSRGQTHEIWTPNGRRFMTRDYKDKRVLPNWCTQGWAATILKDSAIGCKAAGLGDYLRLAVHDELILSVPRKDAVEISHIVEEVMNSQIDPDQFGVAIKAVANIGANWAELK